MSFVRNNVKSTNKYVGAIASAGSIMQPMFYAPAALELKGWHLIMGAGTLTSGWTMNIYKNASAAGSRIGTTGAQGATAAYTAYDFTSAVVSTIGLKRLAAGDAVILEIVITGGDTATGSLVQLDYMYGYEDA